VARAKVAREAATAVEARVGAAMDMVVRAVAAAEVAVAAAEVAAAVMTVGVVVVAVMVVVATARCSRSGSLGRSTRCSCY